MQFNWDGGAYIQDQWRVDRFTFNLGARYDKFNAFIPAQSVPDSNFIKGFSIDQISNMPNWNDWATRVGVSWDVFGNGKTAIKAFAGRFVAGEAFSQHLAVQPDLQPERAAQLDRPEPRRQGAQSRRLAAVHRNRRWEPQVRRT